MSSRSTSLTLLTRKALWPEGIMKRVFLLEPKPICSNHPSVSKLPQFLSPTHKVPTRPRLEDRKGKKQTYRGHDQGAPEASPDTAVDTLGLAPAGIDALEPVTLVTGEALRACTERSQVNISFPFSIPFQIPSPHRSPPG